MTSTIKLTVTAATATPAGTAPSSTAATAGLTAPPGAATPLLQLRGLQSALAGPFSLDLHAGECLAIEGPSGAGKSLLLRMICDLDPHAGQALLDGVECGAMAAPAWRGQVLYQPAEAAWWAPTALAHFAPAQLPRARALLPLLGLDETLLEADVSRLSTGERQRMALVRSLACGPRVLLLDEPTAALDPLAIDACERLLLDQLAQGLAIIIVTHSTTQAARLASQRMAMHQGRLTVL